MPNTREKPIEQRLKKGEESICNKCIHCRVCRAIDNQPCIECNQFADANGDKWISVKDMVPESHVETFDDIDGIHHIVISNFVLGCAADGQMAVVQHEVGDDKEYWTDWHGHNYDITHWMPLPSREETE